MNRKCKCHAAWGKMGQEKRTAWKWLIATAVAVIAIGIVGMIVIIDPALRDIGNKILYPEQSEDRIPGDTRPHAFMGLPPAPHCDHLYDHPGKHKLWASCMGVAYNDSRMDRYLYKNRKGEPPEAAGDVKKEKQ